jgi:hypothetical protein
MGRYLADGFFEAVLNRGKAIECFLGGSVVGGEPAIRWISLRKEDDIFVATLREAWDPRDPEFLDVYAFRSTAPEPDDPVSEERFEDLSTALRFVTTQWGASETRFVNEGIVQDEYGEYLAGLQGPR